MLLGRSLREWLGKMGINAGGKDIRDVREQAERISLCRLTFHVRSGDRVGLLNQNIVETAMFVSAGDRVQGSLFCEVARLSEGFFQQLQRHPVPLEDAALRAIANNSQAIDIYCWLAYRLHALPSPRSCHGPRSRGNSAISQPFGQLPPPVQAKPRSSRGGLSSSPSRCR